MINNYFEKLNKIANNVIISIFFYLNNSLLFMSLFNYPNLVG